jgi:hypothetical protein
MELLREKVEEAMLKDESLRMMLPMLRLMAALTLLLALRGVDGVATWVLRMPL